MASACLSNPAASPTGDGKLRPHTRVCSTGSTGEASMGARPAAAALTAAKQQAGMASKRSSSVLTVSCARPQSQVTRNASRMCNHSPSECAVSGSSSRSAGMATCLVSQW